MNGEKKQSVPWGPLGEVIYLRTYSRFDEEKRRRESWHETVERVVDYSFSLAPSPEPEEERGVLTESMLSLKGFPAGRTLWIGGSKHSREFPLANYNCSFLDFKDETDIYETVILLMSGAGVGFRVTEDNVSRLNQSLPLKDFVEVSVEPYNYVGSPGLLEETILELSEDRETLKIIVGDSREAWAKAMSQFVVACSYREPFSRVKQIVVNTNYVRPLGERLKRFGGYASGPQVLIDFFLDAQRVLFRSPKATWTQTKGLDIMNLIGRTVVAGGTRRCLPEGTLVYTENGPVPIQDVAQGTKVMTLRGWSTVTDHMYQGKQRVLLLETELGSIRATENHRMAVFVNGGIAWIEAGKLRPGNKLVVFAGSWYPKDTSNLFSDDINQVLEQIEVVTDDTYRSFLGRPLGDRLLLLAYVIKSASSYKDTLLATSPTNSVPSATVQVNSGLFSSEARKFLATLGVFLESSKRWSGKETLRLFGPSRLVAEAVVSRGVDPEQAVSEAITYHPQDQQYFVPVIITGIYQEAEEVDTYDLTVADDHMFVADGFLVHNSAQIALGDDRDFATAKTGEWWSHYPWRTSSNNSILFTERPSVSELEDLLFYAYEYGEPGFINAETASHRRDNFRGVNPCLAGDTLVPVPGQGLVFIAELEGKQVPVIDGNGQVVYAKAEKTGENQPLLLVRLSDGSEYKVTPWHEFVLVDGSKRQAKDLQPGDELMPPKGVEGAFGSIHDPERAYVDAWLIANGTWHNQARWAKLYLYPPKHKYKEALEKASGKQFAGPDAQNRYVMVFTGERHALPKDRVPDYVLCGDKETVLAFIRGYLEADGHVRKSKTKGWSVQVVSVHKFFLQQLQALLALLGVHSSIAKLRDGGKHPMPDGNGGYKEYNTRTTYRLMVSNPTKLVAMLGWDTPARGGYNVQKKVRVVAVEDTGERADVFCFGVPTTQSFDLPTCHSGNCSEILLDDSGVCNLVTLNLMAFAKSPSWDGVDWQDLFITARALTRHAIRIALLEFPEGFERWNLVQERDRLIGVSFTGYGNFVDYLNLTPSQQSEFLKKLREVIHKEAREYAAWLGIREPILKTTVKPEGTISLLPGVSHGVHPDWAPYYFRRVRMSKVDAVAQALKALGMTPYPAPETGAKTLEEAHTWVYEFPVKSPAKKTSHEYTAIEQLERYKLVMESYVDHNVSITVNFERHEIPEIARWVHQNWDHYVGISFLRKDASVYPLQPLEAITEEQYKVAKLLMPDLSRFKETVDAIERGDYQATDDLDLSCATGVCPVR